MELTIILANRPMKNIMIMIIMMLGYLPIQAQQQNRPDTKERIKKISQELGIDKEKSTSLVKVLDQYQQSISQVMKNDKLEGKAKQEQLKILMQEQQQSISGILSAEEQGKLKSLMSSKYEGARKAREKEVKDKNQVILNKKKQ